MRSGVIVAVAILVALFFFTRGSSGTSDQVGSQSSGSSRVTGHLNVVPTIRSITVSPGSVNFGNCNGGNGATDSTGGSLGYPNATCSVGGTGANATYPITITYTGLPGEVDVSATNAVPADGGTAWSLCNPLVQGQSPPACDGGQGLPGKDQYELQNQSAAAESGVALTTTSACDKVFDAGGSCSASPAEFTKQTQHENLFLIGPRTWDDHSTSWTMTITWTAIGS